MDTFEDFEARQAAADQPPDGLEGTSPSDWAEYVAHGPITPASEAISNKVNGLTDDVQAQEEAEQEALDTPEWEADESYFESEELPDLEVLSPADAAMNYAKEQIDAALAGFDQTDPGVQAWKEDYDARQQAWRAEQAEQVWNENERLLNAAGRQGAQQQDANASYENGKIRQFMGEGYAALRDGLTSQGATNAEADQVIMEHFGSDEALAEHLGQAAAIAARNESIGSRIFNGPGWNKRTG
jgi:hypothetical protein